MSTVTDRAVEDRGFGRRADDQGRGGQVHVEQDAHDVGVLGVIGRPDPHGVVALGQTDKGLADAHRRP